jgi:hypothetical protein
MVDSIRPVHPVTAAHPSGFPSHPDEAMKHPVPPPPSGGPDSHNENAGMHFESITWSYNRDLHLVISKLVDDLTGRVVQQIPPQELIDYAEAGRRLRLKEIDIKA